MTQLVRNLALGESLSRHPFVAGLSQAHADRLASIASVVEFGEDEVILIDGQRSLACYLLVTGSVAVELSTPRVKVCVQVLQAGKMFGWSALLAEQDTLFQVRARERTTAVRLDGAELAEACRKDAQFAAEMLRRALQVAAGRVKATEAAFAEMCGVRV